MMPAVLAVIAALGLSAPGASARTALCDVAAHQAAQATGVPLPVMRALTRVETGRNRGSGLEPWPWTVNMEGKGHWFTTREEAEQFVSRAIARGARSFDIGCFQINHHWHGTAFRSVTEMFDPARNALYAARFMRQLQAESGDWSVAAGWFHSRTPHLADGYRARFERVRASLDTTPPAGTGATGPGLPAMAPSRRAMTAPMTNRFPLLTDPGTVGARGSLVPLGTAARAPLVPALAAQGS